MVSGPDPVRAVGTNADGTVLSSITSISRGNLFTFPALLHRERYVTISLSCIFYPFAGIVIYLCQFVRGWLACSKRSIPTPYKIPMPGDV